MSVITTASRQWAARPNDQRFVDLLELRGFTGRIRAESRAVTVSTRVLQAVPTPDGAGLEIHGPNGHGYQPTHFSFGQLAQRADAPAGYLRRLPAPMAADCLNWGFRFGDASEAGILLRRNGDNVLRAATGPKYGRIWDHDVVTALVDRVGDGVSGHWRVPGEFGRAVDVTKANTTLYASDRDIFVFLADESRRIEIPNRRDGKPGSLARGFFVWNSEVGSATFGLATFLFDYVCSNRMIWGASEYKEIRIRHTSAAPDRFMSEIAPALESYAESSDRRVVDTIAAAQSHKLGGREDVDSFLAKRFGPRAVPGLRSAHMLEEGRPIETLWDVVTASTAVARSIPYQDERVAAEREAGRLLDMVAA